MTTRNTIVLAIANQKGGTAKSVTASNLAWSFAQTGALRVLALDLDPQGNLSTMLGEQPSGRGAANMTSVFEGAELAACVTRVGGCLELVVGDPKLADVEATLAATELGREMLLSRQLEDEIADYDVIVLDLPPNQGLLAVNGMVFADWLVVPVRMDDPNAVNGLSDLQRFTQRLAVAGWPREVAYVVRCDVNPRLDIYETLNAALLETGLPLADAQIPSRTAVAQSVAVGMPITRWRPSSDAGIAYTALASELAVRVFDDGRAGALGAAAVGEGS